MELTMELVEVESSLELWTLEGDQKTYISSPGRACGKWMFSPASFKVVLGTARSRSLPQK